MSTASLVILNTFDCKIIFWQLILSYFSFFSVLLVSGTHIVMVFREVLHASYSKLQLCNSDSSRKSIKKGRGMLDLRGAKKGSIAIKSQVCAYWSLYWLGSIMSSISVSERVKSVLNRNDEVILRTIYDDYFVE